MRNLIVLGSVICTLSLCAERNAQEPFAFSRSHFAILSSPSQYLAQQFDQNDYRPFANLPITPDDMRNTYKLIHSLGTLSWYELLWQKREIEGIGDRVEHLHPFRFLALIFRDPHLKQCMGNIYGSSLKWHRFLKGLSEKMEKKSKAGELMPHLPGFCYYTNSEYDKVKPLIEAHNWEGLLKYLIFK